MKHCEYPDCVSLAINDDPDGKLCDCCWRDRRIAELEADNAYLRTRQLPTMADMRAGLKASRWKPYREGEVKGD